MVKRSVISTRQYYKRNKVLNIIRAGKEVSRYDIKKETLYSLSTVSEIIDDLLAQNLIFEEICKEPRIGRRPIWLRLNPSGAFFIGVEFNAQMMYCATLNLVGEVVWQEKTLIHPSDGSENIMEYIYTSIDHAIAQVPNGKHLIYGICVGSPGYIDKEAGIAISYTHLNHWENVPLRSLLEKRYQLPCYIDNNVNVMAFAYKWLYFHGEAKDFIFVSMRMGVRMVPFLNNQPVLSRTGVSGELGHIHIGHGSRPCSCGRYGCLNSEISNDSILSIIREGLVVGRFSELLEMAGGCTQHITIELFCSSVHQKHPDSVRLMIRIAQFLGEALALVANLYSPEIIVLSGTLIMLGEQFIQAVHQAMKPLVIEHNTKHLQIVPSAFDSYIGAIGAAALVMQEELEFIDKPI